MATNIRRLQYAILMGAFTPVELRVLANPGGIGQVPPGTRSREALLEQAMSLSDEPIRDLETFSNLAAVSAADCLRHNPNGAAFSRKDLCRFAFEKTVRAFRGRPSPIDDGGAAEPEFISAPLTGEEARWINACVMEWYVDPTSPPVSRKVPNHGELTEAQAAARLRSGLGQGVRVQQMLHASQTAFNSLMQNTRTGFGVPLP